MQSQALGASQSTMDLYCRNAIVKQLFFRSSLYKTGNRREPMFAGAGILRV
jgi:hypothetical protein